MLKGCSKGRFPHQILIVTLWYVVHDWLQGLVSMLSLSSLTSLIDDLTAVKCLKSMCCNSARSQLEVWIEGIVHSSSLMQGPIWP